MLSGKKVKEDLDKIQKEMEEHLSGINDNTSEIQSLFDYLHQIEIKLDKLSQRLDQTQLSQGNNQPVINQKPAVIPLNQNEKKIFLVLYTEEMALSYPEIANKSQISISVVPECVSCLSSKGIPIIRTFCNDQVFIKIEPHFKEMQAKENLINLSLQSFM